MRFLIVSQYFEPEIGAAQARLGAFARGLVKEGHEVEVVTGMPNHPNGEIATGYKRCLFRTERTEGFLVRRVWLYAACGSGLRRVLNYLSFMVMSMFGLLKSKRPDYIFVESPPLSVMVPARFFATIWRRPIILNVADLWLDVAKNLNLMSSGRTFNVLQKLEKNCYKSASYISSVTDGVRVTLETNKGVPSEKILDLPNGVDIEMFKPRSEDSSVLKRFGLEGKDVFLYAGTVGYAHGLETGVDAMAKIEREYPRAHLLVVGGGSEWEKVSTYAREGGAQNVTFAGPVPLEEVAQLLNASVAAVSTLRDSEVLNGVRPSKIFPAMASGVPVLYSGAGEGANLITNSRAGLVSSPGDSTALSENIKEILSDSEQVVAMGAAGRTLAEEQFSWSMIIERWLKKVDEIS